MINTMPNSALNATEIDFVLTADGIIDFLIELGESYKMENA